MSFKCFRDSRTLLLSFFIACYEFKKPIFFPVFNPSLVLEIKKVCQWTRKIREFCLYLQRRLLSSVEVFPPDASVHWCIFLWNLSDPQRLIKHHVLGLVLHLQIKSLNREILHSFLVFKWFIFSLCCWRSHIVSALHLEAATFGHEKKLWNVFVRPSIGWKDAFVTYSFKKQQREN